MLELIAACLIGIYFGILMSGKSSSRRINAIPNEKRTALKNGLPITIKSEISETGYYRVYDEMNDEEIYVKREDIAE
ncbi:hypothetical protein H6G33_10145 [Calothrix sp. FACHB-1219]|uniref:hypothetical protein n=1 Tax=unclassified Calothrix TaxID=2619626 RepID=UPI00168A2F4E|nr:MULTISPECIES: hypothetical protein [unclassified Calothrix]MBD2201708.1 hypothetical protein [Calothrix sp. FACHB-168]MBD2217394.1 hypothetical protein [Calothrix sp. FACHB-1219]